MSKSGDNGNKDGKDENGDDGRLIPFPGGKKIDPAEIGADFVVSSSKAVATSEITDPVEVSKELQARVSYVKHQELVRVMERGAPTAEAIDVLLKEIAEEISHLKWERRKASKVGKSTTSYTTARISSLRSLSEILIRRKEAAVNETLDIKSPKFQKIFTIWMNFFYESMQKAGVSDEIINVVFQQMKADMLDWESRIREVE